ncbi:MAG: hypothetical protein PHE79_12080 [Eubacteriales bacterium]|nr:hypothetical protein [Eubacteriales bacterium]
MSENALIKAEKAHDGVKYYLEQDFKRYAPYVPEVQVLLGPPNGNYCNADYVFCPHLLWGGFCTEHYKSLQMLDGWQFTTITAKQFWACLGEPDKQIKYPDSGTAVGSYRVFRKCCKVSK